MLISDKSMVIGRKVRNFAAVLNEYELTSKEI